jgi:hypothetical protein
MTTDEKIAGKQDDCIRAQTAGGGGGDAGGSGGGGMGYTERIRRYNSDGTYYYVYRDHHFIGNERKTIEFADFIIGTANEKLAYNSAIAEMDTRWNEFTKEI